MERLSIEEQFQDLSEVSEVVSSYLQEHMFKYEFPDEADYSQQDLLMSCYELLFSELRDYGVRLVADVEEVLADLYLCKHFYYLKYILQPQELIRRITQFKDIQDELEDIVNNDESKEDVFIHQQVLDTIFKYDKGSIYYQYLIYIENEYTVNYRFLNYIKNVLKLIKEGDLSAAISNTDRAQRYINKINGLRTYAKQAVQKILDNLQESDIDLAKINKMLDDYDLDKINPDRLKIYSLIDLDKDIPTSLAKYKEAMMLEHHQRAAHHIEYYYDPHKIPKPIITNENIILIVAHHNEPDTTPTSFWEEMEETLKLAKEHDLFTTDQIALYNHLGNILYPTIQEAEDKQPQQVEDSINAILSI